MTLWAPDPEQLAPFYAEVLGLERQDIHGHVPNFRVGEMLLVLMRGTPAHVQDSDNAPWPIFAFEVPNYAEILARVEVAGVPILRVNPPHDPSPLGYVRRSCGQYPRTGRWP